MKSYDIFGGGTAKVIDFLITYKKHDDHSEAEIARGAGISYRQTLRIIYKLQKLKIVKLTRVVGKARLFSLNGSSNQVDGLIRIVKYE